MDAKNNNDFPEFLFAEKVTREANEDYLEQEKLCNTCGMKTKLDEEDFCEDGK